MPARVRFSKHHSEIKPVLGITRQNNFVPQFLAKIRQDSMIFPVKLKFEASKITMESNRQNTYEDGKFIARSFLRAGIKGISFREFLGNRELQQLQQVVEAAQQGFVTPLLPQNLRTLGFITEIEEISETEAIAEGLPGFYKHYTDYQGYQKILASGVIEAQTDSKNGKIRKGVYLTPLTLSAEEAHELLFMRKPELKNRGFFVVSFEILDDGLAREIVKNGIELFQKGSISLENPGIRVSYQGPNHFQAAA